MATIDNIELTPTPTPFSPTAPYPPSLCWLCDRSIDHPSQPRPVQLVLSSLQYFFLVAIFLVYLLIR